jgi:hypothetical protein
MTKSSASTKLTEIDVCAKDISMCSQVHYLKNCGFSFLGIGSWKGGGMAVPALWDEQ